MVVDKMVVDRMVVDKMVDDKMVFEKMVVDLSPHYFLFVFFKLKQRQPPRPRNKP